MVAKLETVQFILSLSADQGWQVHHLDVKSAFLNGELRKEVYVCQPEGFVTEGEENKVYRLTKALYGLWQATRAWNVWLNGSLKQLGFERCPQEEALYKRCTGSETFLVGVYVDDLIVTGNSLKGIKRFKHQLMQGYEMTDLGLLAYYLGIEVVQENDTITLKQTAYGK